MGLITKLFGTYSERELKSIAGKNSEAHARLWGREAEQDQLLQEHEVRLTRLEKE